MPVLPRTRRARSRLARLAAAAALAPAVLLLGGAGASAAPRQDPTVAPVTTVSADGRSVSGAGKTLAVSQAHGLAAGGQAVTVSGAGYDSNKGVYVALCVIPPTNMAPSPCGGGADRAGTERASAWISSNPPSYAAGLTQPYGDGGTFTVTLQVGPAINDSLDCYSVRCAIVTRNDHTRSSDRSQDLFLPVSFAPAAVAPAAPTTTAPAPTTTAPVVTTTTTTAAPPTTARPTTARPTTWTTESERTAEDAALASTSSDGGGGGAGAAPAQIAAAFALAGAGAVGVRAGLRRRRTQATAP